MNITNFFDTFTAPAFVYFGAPPPSPDDSEFETKNAEYEKNRDAFLELVEVGKLNDNVTLKFSLGSVLFDIINSAIQQKVMATPESPKLAKRLEKEMLDFATGADGEGEISLPDSWIPYIDKMMNDDSLFSEVAIHGELNTKEKKSMPLRSRIINSMPKLRDALLEILPA